MYMYSLRCLHVCDCLIISRLGGIKMQCVLSSSDTASSHTPHHTRVTLCEVMGGGCRTTSMRVGCVSFVGLFGITGAGILETNRATLHPVAHITHTTRTHRYIGACCVTTLSGRLVVVLHLQQMERYT